MEEELKYKQIVNEQLMLSYSTYDLEKIKKVIVNLNKVVNNQIFYGQPTDNTRMLLKCAEERLKEFNQ